MQMTVERDALLRAVSCVAGIVATKTEFPILSHLLIAISGDGGSVRATNLDMEISAPFDAEVHGSGQLTVPARLLNDILKRMPASAQINIVLDGDRLKLTCGSARFKLAFLPAEDYAELELVASKTSIFEIEGRVLRGMLAGVRHAISTDEHRPYLQGVCLSIIGKNPAKLTAVATNGHILALQRIETQTPGMPEIIIPAKTVGELIKMLPDSDDMVSVTVSASLMKIDLPDGRSLSSKLIDGKYPDYEQVIPRDNPNVAGIDKARLTGAVNRVSSLCNGDHAAISLSFMLGEPIRVATEHQFIGQAEEVVEASVESPSVMIGCNYRYLLAILDSLAGSAVEIHFQGPADPMLFRIDGSYDVLNVLSPMRV